MNHAKVHQFIEVFADWLTYQRVKETERLMDNPSLTQRSYTEALREITQKLTETLNTNTGGTYGITGRGAGRRY